MENLYRNIPYVKKPVSRILFGSAFAPFDSGEGNDELLDAMVELGINAIDLARVYGNAERNIGRWMAKRGNRDKLVLLTKGAHPSPAWEKRVTEKDILADFQRSCEELQTDYIDIYILHRDDPEVEVAVAVETLNALHADGKIGAFGGSNWSHRRIAEANVYAQSHGLVPFTVSSPHFSLAEQIADIWGDGLTITGSANAEARDWYQQNQMSVVAHSSMARGFLSGKLKSTGRERAAEILDHFAVKGFCSEENFRRLERCEQLAAEKNCTVAQIGLAWLFGQKINTFAVISTSRPERMQQNIDALRLTLSQEELDWLDLGL